MLKPDTTPLEALAEGVKGLAGAFAKGKAERAAREARERYDAERRELRERNAGVHGTSRWSTVAELQASDLLGRADEVGRIAARIPIGPLAVWDGRTEPLDAPHPDHFAFWNGDNPGHFLTIGGMRAGKGASQIVPTLLHYPGSCLVVDPKGDIYRDTAGWRHLQGSKIIRIAPFDEDGDTDAFNPMDYVDSVADARVLAETLIPRRAERAEARFFENEAINFLAAVIPFVKRHSSPNWRNIGGVRLHTTTRPRDELVRFLERMIEIGEPPVAAAAKIVHDRATAGGGRDKFIELFRSLDAEMAVWDDPGMQAATRRSDVDFRSLKDDIVTVYLEVPFRKMESHGALLRAFFTQAASALCETLGELEVPVLFLIDEFPQMGPMPGLVSNLSYLYGHGVRVWMFAQTFSGLERVYADSARLISESAELKLYLSIHPPGSDIVSRELGPRTTEYETVGTSANQGRSTTDAGDGSDSGGHGGSRTQHFGARPLLTADEVTRWTNRTRADDPNLGLLTIAVARDRRFCVNRPYFFKDPAMDAMVKRGKAHLAATDREALKEVYRPR